MSLKSALGSFQQPLTTGNQSVTGLDFQPKIIFFWGNGRTTDGSASQSRWWFGITLSTSSRCVGGSGADDTQDTSITHICYGNNYSIIGILGGASPSIGARADLVSMNIDGFTFNWSLVDSYERITNYLALGGSDITNVYRGSANTNTTTGNQSFIGVGFKPDFLMLFAPGSSTITFEAPLNISSSNSSPDIGFAVSSVSQGHCSGRHVNAQGTMDSARRQLTTHCFGPSSSTDVFQEYSFVSFDNDGFTLNLTTAPASTRYFWFVCIKGGSHYVGSFNQSTSTGNQSITGVGFNPSGTVFRSFNNITSNSTLTHHRISDGAALSSSNRFSIWDGDRDGIAISKVDRNLDRTKCFKMMTENGGGAPTLNTAADFVSNDLDGYTINNTTVDATSREIIFWNFGSYIKNYSREDAASLPTTDTDLSNLFTRQEYSDVAYDDAIRVIQLGTEPGDSIFLFKDKFEQQTDFSVTVDVQSDRAPSITTVYLQIYNRTSLTWTTLASNSVAVANIDFVLSGSITSNLNQYYDVNGWVSCRVYQRAI